MTNTECQHWSKVKMILKAFNALAGVTKQRAEVGHLMEAAKTWNNCRYTAEWSGEMSFGR